MDKLPAYEGYLLFGGQPEPAAAKNVCGWLAEKCGGAEQKEDGWYHLTAYDANVIWDAPEAFAQQRISDFNRGQFWNIKNANGLLAGCSHMVRLQAVSKQGIDYKQHGKMLVQLIEAALQVYPSCIAVYTPASGRLVTAEQVQGNPARGGDRFLYLCVNTRFFSISGTNSDMMMDTVGLHLLGLPDVQYHFHSIDPNKLMKHAYSVASLLYTMGAMMRDEETIDGMDEGGITREIRWKFQYEHALIEPPRIVMAIQPGEYAI